MFKYVQSTWITPNDTHQLSYRFCTVKISGLSPLATITHLIPITLSEVGNITVILQIKKLDTRHGIHLHTALDLNPVILFCSPSSQNYFVFPLSWVALMPWAHQSVSTSFCFSVFCFSQDNFYELFQCYGKVWVFFQFIIKFNPELLFQG